MGDNRTERLHDWVRLLEKTVPYAAGLWKRRSGMRINVNRVEESAEPVNPSEGIVLTLWNGQRFFERAFNASSVDSIKNELTDWAKGAMSQVDANLPTLDIDPGPTLEKDFVLPVETNPDSVPLRDRLAIARHRVEMAVKRDKKVTNINSVLGHVVQDDAFVNRNKILTQNITRVDEILLVFVSDGQKTAEVYKGYSKNGGMERLRITDEEIEALVEDGKRLLPATRLTPGTYTTVSDPEWSGIIAHECFGHGMETDLYVRKRALSEKFIGQMIASPIVNMFDDPSDLLEAGGFYFDDEGQISTPTQVIKDGQLMRGLTDLASSQKLKLIRSANGRRESYARKAYARMTNTYFAKGQSTKEEIISSVKDGLYLRYATNGMEDPQAWGIQVEGLWAEEIKNGKLTGKIYSPVIMTGFVPDLLKSVSMVGNDRFISGLGMCGKGHKEWVKNTTGGPHLKFQARLA